MEVMDLMKSYNERELAVNVLIDIFENGFYGNIALRKTLNGCDGLLPRQKAFVTELVNGTLRNVILLDYIINNISDTSTEKMKPLILNTLRISVFQMKFLDRVPVSAVCNEAVSLVKRRGLQRLSGFVNGVLRNIARRMNEIPFPSEKKSPEQYLSIKYSYSTWLVRHFLSVMSLAEVEAMFAVNNTAPRLTLCCNTIKATRDDVREALLRESQGVTEVETCAANERALFVNGISGVSDSPAFKDGLFHVMDLGSMLAVDVLDPHPGETVIDVCAAPGGKSFYMAGLMGNVGRIYSRDIYEHKIELIKAGAERLGIAIITAQKMDAAVFDPGGGSVIADRILVDAPCSGFGIVRKKPEIKYTKTPEDIDALVKLQREILQTSARYLKPGGILVYSTCTISPRENEENVKWFTENFPFELEPFRIGLNGDEQPGDEQPGYVQLLPSRDMDGFFIAKLRKIC